MRIVTKDLYKAAFYKTYRAKLIGMDGQYPSKTFYLDASWWSFLLEKIGLVNYRKFRNQRIALKEKSLKQRGFNFMEVAHL